MHTVDFDQIGKPLVTPILFYHKTRDHTGHSPAGSQRSIRHGTHQARIASPVDHSQVPFAQQMSQLGRSLPICRSDLRAGGTIHANGSYLISFSFHLSFCIMILKQRGFNKPSTEIIRLSAFQNHLFSLIYIISEQGEIAQARIIREDMRQGLGYLKRRFQGGGSLLCQTKFQ